MAEPPRVRLIAVLGSATPPGRLHRAVAEALDRAADADVELIDLGEQRNAIAPARPRSGRPKTNISMPSRGSLRQRPSRSSLPVRSRTDSAMRDGSASQSRPSAPLGPGLNTSSRWEPSRNARAPRGGSPHAARYWASSARVASAAIWGEPSVCRCAITRTWRTVFGL